MDKNTLAENKAILTENGVTDFVIVLPDNPSHDERYAADELCRYLYRACKAEPVIMQESLLKTDKFISIGETALLKGLAEADYNKERLGTCGYIVKTKGTCAFICGGGGIGTIYAVYEFLKHHIGFEAYACDEIAFDQKPGAVELAALNIEEIPDIPFRNGFGRKYYLYPQNAYLLRFNVLEDVFIRDSIQPWHNSLRYFPPEEYAERHPDWYLPSKNDIHFTANNNKEELKLLQEELFLKLKKHIEKSFSEGQFKEVIAFTHNDFGEWAKDESVKAYMQKYGDAYPAATLIHFLNPVAKRVKSFLSKQYPGRKVYILFFAYSKTLLPPVKKQNGKYVPIDASVVPEDNLMVLYAPLNADFYSDLSHPGNKRYLEALEGWKALSGNISFWIYSVYVKNTIMFFDNFDSIQENIRIMKESGAYYVFNESNFNYSNVAFNALKEYVTAKLLWDCNQDMSGLIDSFMRNYYKEAAPYMQKVFELLRENYKRLNNIHILPKHITISDEIDREQCWWPQSRIDEYLELFQQAYEEIKPLQYKNLIYYNLVYDRICSESIMFRYLELKHYSQKYSAQELDRQRLSFRSDTTRLGITRFSSKKGYKDLSFVIRQWVSDDIDMPLVY